ETISWVAEGGVNYVVQVSTNLAAGFVDASPIISSDADGEIVDTWVDAGAATNSGFRFYRIRVEP
ncbi:MAG TPA: hypothetical protein VFF11_07895, partial [Candidatus Binatia bacterium]|nr:hypothetical protein [Candidatus Binatia bacterium]